MGNSAIDRNPAVFGDLRGWIDALRDAGELEEIKGEVDWDVELGNIIRMMQGSGDGPAFLFDNIAGFSQSCGIHNMNRHPANADGSLNGITRGSGYLRDNGSFFFDQLIQ